MSGYYLTCVSHDWSVSGESDESADFGDSCEFDVSGESADSDQSIGFVDSGEPGDSG